MIEQMTSVLVIDDDAAFRMLAVRMLSESGLTVVGEADSVGSGRAAAVELRPDAVLVDVMLPDGDGVALAHELAELAWGPRVLITSGSPEAVPREHIASGSVVGFVPKVELPSASLGRLLGGD